MNVDILQDISNKLDRILIALAVPNHAVAPVAADLTLAYNRPEITVDEVTVFDGNTYQRDGSVWQRTTTDFSPKGGQPIGTPFRLRYGYLSPVKTPEVWAKAAQVFGDHWTNVMEPNWQRNRYAIYNGDIPLFIREGTMDLNFMILGMLMTPGPSFVQD